MNSIDTPTVVVCAPSEGGVGLMGASAHTCDLVHGRWWERDPRKKLKYVGLGDLAGLGHGPQTFFFWALK